MIENVVLHTRLIEKLFPSLFVQLYQIEMKSIDIWVRVENYIWKPMLRVSATKKLSFTKKILLQTLHNHFQFCRTFRAYFWCWKAFNFHYELFVIFSHFFCRCLTAASPARYGVITFRFLGCRNIFTLQCFVQFSVLQHFFSGFFISIGNYFPFTRFMLQIDSESINLKPSRIHEWYWTCSSAWDFQLIYLVTGNLSSRISKKKVSFGCW